MKKQFTLILCCLAVLFSGMSQPIQKQRYDNLFQKNHPEKKLQKNLLEREKIAHFNKQLSHTKIQSSLKKLMNDIWKPDTINFYDLDENIHRQVYKYENGNLAQRTTQEPFDIDWWESVYRATYYYDSQKNLTESIEEIREDWDTWINCFMSTMTYDAQNNLKEYFFYGWENDWELYFKNTYIYNTQNKLTEVIFYDVEEEPLMEVLKISIAYDELNNITSELWQFFEDIWEDEMRILFTYDEQNNRISELWQWEDGYGWEDEIRISFSYDDQSNRISELWQDWDGKWENMFRYVLAYDENHNLISGYYQEWENSMWIDDEWGIFDRFFEDYKELSIMFFSYFISYNYYFQDAYRFEASYFIPDVGIEENRKSHAVTLYPNPVSNILKIETNPPNQSMEVKIYSVQGNLLLQSRKDEIDISALQNGIYIANINGICRKFVKL